MNTPYVPPGGYQQQPQETVAPARPFDLTSILGTDRAREAAMVQENSPYSFLRQVNEQRSMMFGHPEGGM